MEDDKLVDLFLNRDENAIRLSAEKYGSRLRALALRITSDYQTSEECENDTYLQAWNLIPPNEPRTYLYAFLARIVRHISIDRCRERASLKRNVYIEELTEEMEQCIPAVDDVEDCVEAKLLGEEISRFLYKLPDEKQVMFIRRYYYLDTVSEIASRLSITDSKVKTTLFRIRKELRDYLIRKGYSL